jgi:hypothetical protein
MLLLTLDVYTNTEVVKRPHVNFPLLISCSQATDGLDAQRTRREERSGA